MGPRNTRRVAWIGAGLAAIALIVAAIWLTRPDNQLDTSGSKPAAADSSGKTASSDDGHAAHTFYDRGHVIGKLVYGMTKPQVLNRVGRPAKVIRWQGMPCWQYNFNEHYPATPAGPGYTLDATAACFLAGKFAVSRYKIDGKWGYNLRTKKVTD